MGQLKKEDSATTKGEVLYTCFQGGCIGKCCHATLEEWHAWKLNQPPFIKLMILVLTLCWIPSVHHTTTPSIHTFHSLTISLYKWFLFHTPFHIPISILCTSHFRHPTPLTPIKSTLTHSFNYTLSKPNRISPATHTPHHLYIPTPIHGIVKL